MSNEEDEKEWKPETCKHDRVALMCNMCWADQYVEALRFALEKAKERDKFLFGEVDGEEEERK